MAKLLGINRISHTFAWAANYTNPLKFEFEYSSHMLLLGVSILCTYSYAESAPDEILEHQVVAWVTVIQEDGGKCLFLTKDEDGNYVDPDGNLVTITAITATKGHRDVSPEAS